ncbi:unnamed protein product [Didymodactylos carnosus]|nr:unnamed protein product [Didymodactylos carnosus]CAF4294714.1 unnamed protein product [Didymodactylos carnosus]
MDILIDDKDRLYVADTKNQRVVRFINGSKTGTIIGGGFRKEEQLIYPTHLFMGEKNDLYVVDQKSFLIKKISPNGRMMTVAGTGYENSTMNSFGECHGLYVDRSNNLYVSDAIHDRILKFSPNMTTGTLVIGNHSTPFGIAVDEENDILYVTDWSNHRIQKFKLNDGKKRDGITVAGTGQQGSDKWSLDSPVTVKLDCTHNIYVVDQGNHRIQRFSVNSRMGETIAGGKRIFAEQEKKIVVCLVFELA